VPSILVLQGARYKCILCAYAHTGESRMYRSACAVHLSVGLCLSDTESVKACVVVFRRFNATLILKLDIKRSQWPPGPNRHLILKSADAENQHRRIFLVTKSYLTAMTMQKF